MRHAFLLDGVEHEVWLSRDDDRWRLHAGEPPDETAGLAPDRKARAPEHPSRACGSAGPGAPAALDLDEDGSGHLTIAGFAELFVTASLLAFVQRTDPSLLQWTAPGAAFEQAGGRSPQGVFGPARGLWITLGLLMLLTPLGILAVGTAWGEWAPADFASENSRAEIARASLGIAPPEKAPEGLSRLAGAWTAPIPDYAPPFLKSPSFGYLLSAMFGAGLSVIIFQGFAWILARGRP